MLEYEKTVAEEELASLKQQKFDQDDKHITAKVHLKNALKDEF